MSRQLLRRVLQRFRTRPGVIALLTLLAAGAVASLVSPPAEAQDVRPLFFSTTPTWGHHVEIKIPFRDANNDGRNDYSPQFALEVRQAGGSRPTGDGRCPTALTMTPRVGGSGSEVLATASELLLDIGCQLQTEFPQSIPSGLPGVMLTRSAGFRAQVTSSVSDTARVTYTDGRTTFQPDLSVSGFGPEDEGTVVKLRFSPAITVTLDEACRVHDDQREVRWRVNARGHAVRERQATLISTTQPHAPDFGRECRYAASWPNIEGFDRPDPHSMILAGGSGHVTGRYNRQRVIEATSFTPRVHFVVPFTDYDQDGAHDYRGARLSVTFNRAAGEPSLCPASVSAEYEVASPMAAAGTVETLDGPVRLPARSTVAPVEKVSLIDRPRNSQHKCRYEVEFPAADDPAAGDPAHLALATDPTDDAEVVSSAPVAIATYENAAVVTTVRLLAETPPEAVDEEFGAVVTPASAEEPGCSPEEVVTLSSNGIEGQATADVSLIDFRARHASADDRCEYSVIWGADENGDGTTYQRVGSSDSIINSQVFDAATPVVQQTYGVIPTTFGAVLEVLTNTPVTYDTEFTVSVTRDATADAGCSELADQRVTVFAGRTSGQLAVNGIVSSIAGVAEPCAYSVGWPDGTTGAVAWERDTTYATVTALNEQSHIATARYYPVFNATLEISTTLPVTARTNFVVPVAASASSPSGCSTPDALNISIELNTTSGTGVLDRLTSVPPDATTGCSYEVTWPDNEEGVAPFAWVADRSHGTTSELTLDAGRATHRYQSAQDSTFEADIVAHVPPIDGLTPGVNLFAGTEFTFTVARSPQSHSGCSTGTPNSFIFTVAPDGSVTGEHPTHLVHIPAGTTEECVYLFTATTASSMPDDDLHWALQIETISAHIQQGSAQALVEYRVGDITFTPEVSIAVPQIDARIDGVETNVFADAPMTAGATGPLTFDVGVTRTAASEDLVGCGELSSQPAIFTVQPDGSVAGTLSPLAAYEVVETEVGHRFTQTATPCAYEAVFPAVSGGQPWLAKSADSTDSTNLAPVIPAMATYEAAEVVADVGLSVTSPTVTPPAADRAVSVTISTAAGADAACRIDDGTQLFGSTKSKSVTLEADGTTDAAAQFTVVDLPAGATSADDRCSYDVAWSQTDEPADPTGTAIWTRAEGDMTWAPAGRAGLAGTLVATYQVPLAESFDDATLVLVVAPHVGAGTEFTVEIDPTASSPAGCSDISRTLSAPGPDANNDRTISDTFSLLHTVAGQVTHCAYEVTWPDDEDGPGVLFVPDAGFTPDTTLSKASRTARNRYADTTREVPLDASLTVVTAEAVAVDTTFTVTIAAPATPTGCSATTDDNEVVVLANTARATSQVALIRRPANELTDCVYALTWQPNEDGGTAWVLDGTFAAGELLSAASPAAASRYAPNVTWFAPSVAFAVPPADFDDDGSHDYAGAHFSVAFASTDEACSQVTRAYELSAAGEVEPVAPFRLIDRHATAECSYTVTFPPETTDVDPALYATADPTDDQTLTATMNDAAATYREGVTRFDANLYIGGTHTIDDEDAVNPIPVGTPFTVTIRPPVDAPAGCDANAGDDTATSLTVTMVKSAALERQPHTELTRREIVGLVDTTETGEVCVYEVVWPANEDDGTEFIIDTDPNRPFDDEVRAGNSDDVGAVVWYRAAVMPDPPTPLDDPPDDAGGTAPPSSGGPRSPSSARSTGAGGGSRSGGSSSPGPWVVAPSRIPVNLTLTTPADGPSADGTLADGPSASQPIEVLVNSPGNCADDLAGFAGLPAGIGLVFAVSAPPGASIDVLGGTTLLLAHFATRADQTRDCELRVTLLRAPDLCVLDDAQLDEAGRSYLTVDGGEEATTFDASLSLSCEAPATPSTSNAAAP